MFKHSYLSLFSVMTCAELSKEWNSLQITFLLLPNLNALRPIHRNLHFLKKKKKGCCRQYTFTQCFASSVTARENRMSRTNQFVVRGDSQDNQPLDLEGKGEGPKALSLPGTFSSRLPRAHGPEGVWKGKLSLYIKSVYRLDSRTVSNRHPSRPCSSTELKPLDRGDQCWRTVALGQS